MFNYVKNSLSKLIKSRLIVLVVLFALLAGILIQRLYTMQIINGEKYLTDFTMQIKKETTLKSTRGNIYDRDGNAVAYNKLAYNVTYEDVGSYDTTRERNLAMNGSLYQIMKVIEDGGDQVYTNYAIDIGSDGQYEFTREGFNLLRFRADIFGYADTEDLKTDERNCTAEEMMQTLSTKKWYGIDLSVYTEEELQEYGLPSSFTKEEQLKLTALRSAVAQNSYQKYVTTTIAKDISKDTVAVIMENKDRYPGVDVEEDSIRVYEDGLYMAPLIGYTGQVSAEELEELNGENGNGQYSSSDIVGKSGLEKYFEKELRGQNGTKTVYVDNLGKVLKEDSEVAPQAGNDIHLTIDRNLQIAVYKILEQYIAGIVYNKIFDAEKFDKDSISSEDDILIPIYDVYYSLFENNVLDADHLASDDASDNEKRIYSEFQSREEEIFSEIRGQMTSSSATAYQDLSEEMQVYESFIVDDVLIEGTEVLDKDKIDTNDEMWTKWSNDGSVSLNEFLSYAISKNWIDITKVNSDTTYLDTSEITGALADYVTDYLSKSDAFSRQVYKYMIQNYQISGKDICLLLFDQGILKMNEEDYSALENGAVSAYDFIMAKIYSLEITPAMLALEPCTGSAVITDPDNGDVLACVTYPGYDNNRLANNMDDDYFYKLNSDKSSPFYNKATQEVTAPGSTFKIVAATAGVMEGVVGAYDTINCTGKFQLIPPDVNCWIYSERYKSGSHGPLTLSQAITESCNFYFNTVGYMLGKTSDFTNLTPETDADGNVVQSSTYNDAQAISTLTKYAAMYGFDANTGIEIDETAPHVSTADGARTAMGQAGNTFTTSQLSRYAATIANNGTCYDLTLLDRITDSDNNTLEEPEPVVHSTVDLSSDLWNVIHSGMNGVYQNNAAFTDIKSSFNMAGKTGTAQENQDKPNHALFIGYAPYDTPEIAMAVRITNGYSSTNAASVAKDIVSYYFKLKDESDIITNTAANVNVSNSFAD